MHLSKLMNETINLFDNKVLVAVGNWEPLFHRIRTGGYPVNTTQAYAHEHSDDMARQLSDEGINLVLMHFYKGIGFEFEKEEMENTRRFIEYCHKYDIFVGTYTQWGTFWAETFLNEYPNALEYCQKDRFGRPSLYSETYWSYHRYRTCASSPEFRKILKQIVQYSVEHVGTDLVYFDNLGQNPCYCHRCKQGFIGYLQNKYPDKNMLADRFGFNDLKFVNLPFGADRNPIDSMEIIADPLTQEWVEFRCLQLYEGLNDIRQFLGTLGRKVPLAFNPPILYGDNAPLVWGTDWLRILNTSRFFYSEDPNLSGLTNDGRLITQHRVFKTARYFNNSCFRFHSHCDKGDDVADELIAISEAAMLNNGNLATVKYYGSITKPMAEKKKQYIKYFGEHECDYAGVEQLSEVGVYKNFESLTWAWPQIYPKLSIVEQLLIQSGTQFSYVINNSLDELHKFKALVIADMWCLSEKQAQRIAQYVESGGRLLVLGKTGSRDLRFRSYPENILAKMLGKINQTQAQAMFIALGAGAGGGFKNTDNSIQQEWKFGKGKICWIREAINARPVNPKIQGQIWMIDNSFWDVPSNWKEILDSLDRLLGGRWIPLQVPARVVPQVSRRPGNTKDLLIHLVNYDRNTAVSELGLSVSKELGELKKIEWRMPENSEVRELAFQTNLSFNLIIVPKFEYHGTIIYRM